MWKYPWRYRESIACVSGILLVGLALQWTVGLFDFELMRWPVNLLTGIVIIILMLSGLLFRRHSLYQWLTGIPLAVTLIATLTILGIVMGLTPQQTATVDTAVVADALPVRLGLTRMTQSWPFVLIYLFTLVALGSMTLRRIIPFRLADYAFYLNHAGLWLLLFAAGLGSADMERYIMRVGEGEVEWRATDSRGRTIELPIAVELNDFYMEEYPPSLTIIDRASGVSQPESDPVFVPIDPKRPKATIGDWEIELHNYIHRAVRNSDSSYYEVHMPGSSPAADVSVRHRTTGLTRRGWICPGNVSQLYMVLNLDTAYCLAATRPDPKRFVSDITVYRKEGQTAQAQLEVNHPYTAGPWTIYQHSYDELAGNLSTYTVVELVYDPWIIPVYIGIALLAAGSICMLWSGRKQPNNEQTS